MVKATARRKKGAAPTEPPSTAPGFDPRSLATMTNEDVEMADRARRALSVMRGKLPTLNGYAKAVIGDDSIQVVIAAGRPCTDGKTIYLRPNIELGDRRIHELAFCGMRDSFDILRCEACRRDEEVNITLRHEMAHIIFESFQSMTDADKAAIIKKVVREYKPKRPPLEELIKRRIEMIHMTPEERSEYIAANAEDYDRRQAEGAARRQERFTHFINHYEARTARDVNYVEMVAFISPWLPSMFNALEDARVNMAMYKARPGLYKQFRARAMHIFQEGTEQEDGTWVTWRDLPQNSQVMVCLLAKAMGYDYEDYFDDEVVNAVDDPEVTRLVSQVQNVRSARSIYKLGFPLLEALKRQGFFADENDEPDDFPAPPAPTDPLAEPEEGGGSDPDMPPEGESSDGEPSDDSEKSEAPDDGEKSDDGGASTADDTADDDAETDDDDAASSGGDDDPDDAADDATEQSESTSDTADDDQDGAGDPDDDADDDASGAGEGDDEEDADAPDSSGGNADDDDEEESIDDGSDDSAGEGSGDDGASDEDAEPDDIEEGEGTGGAGDISDFDDDDDDDLGDYDPDDDDFADDDEDDGDDGDVGGTGSEAAGDGESEPGPDPMGTPEEAEKALESFGGHPSGWNPLEEDEDHEPTPEELALDRAIIQAEHFDDPSDCLFGVNTYETEGGPAYRLIHGIEASPTDPDNAAYLEQYFPPLETDEGILGLALREMRVAFTVNQKSGAVRNKRSGSINARVLGRRVPVDDDRLFKKNQKAERRNYFVILGLDCSGSTNIGTIDSDGVRRARIARMKAAVHAQAELLNRMGIAFAVYGHTGSSMSGGGYGYTGLINLEMAVIKSPKQKWDDAAKERLHRIAGGSMNLDGHTMEYYRKVCDKQRATDKVIIYYTDGEMPAENFDEELGILVREIKDAPRRGIKIVGIGVDTDSPKQYGLDTIQLDDIRDIPNVVKALKERLG